jgi:hypothetical protein
LIFELRLKLEINEVVLNAKFTEISFKKLGSKIRYFCLDAKYPKNQDLDIFAKKSKFLSRKFPKLGRKIKFRL